MTNNSNEFLNNIKGISVGLNTYSDLVNKEFIQDFQNQTAKIEDNLADIVNQNRDLRIGIVGQVKAGKSSFLNALLFEGEDVLPHAATPMTAALTKLVYSEQEYAKVIFYNRKDWEVIEEQALTYKWEYKKKLEQWKAQAKDPVALTPLMEKTFKKTFDSKIPSNIKACHEIYEMAKDIDVDTLLGTERRITPTNLMLELKQYVGADGTYTPLVKYIELGIKNAFIKNFEIIDTPGLGDPIMSRSQQTKRFLVNCDLVFILSPTTQFLNIDDINFIIKTLPNESIKHAVLVGSKFDSALLDDPSRSRIDLVKGIGVTRSKLNKSAASSLNKAKQQETYGNNAKLLQRLTESLPPYYISALLFNASKKISNNLKLSELEEKILNQLCNRFAGMQPDNGRFLRDFAGIDLIKNKEFGKIAEEKESIIKERSESFIQDQYAVLLKKLSLMIEEAENNLQLIKTEDVDTLHKKMESGKNAISSMRRNMRTLFSGMGLDTHNYIVKMAIDIKKEATSYSGVGVSEESRTEQRSKKVGWWIFGHTETWDVVVRYKKATVDYAVQQVLRYIDDAETSITKELGLAIDIDAKRNKVKDVLLKAYLSTETSFAENDILGPVELVLKEITLPPFKILDREKYMNIICDEFPKNTVEGNEIHSLELSQTRCLQTVAQDISDKLEETARQIKNMLDIKAETFIDDVQQAIEDKISLLQNNLADKESSIKKYEEFIKVLQNYKKDLMKFHQ